MPTQLVSNEEMIPRRQNADQKKMEHLIGELAADRSKRLNMERRDFMRTPMGLATCFLASNMVYGENFEVDEVEAVGWSDFSDGIEAHYLGFNSGVTAAIRAAKERAHLVIA